jgi:hypothetical protein
VATAAYSYPGQENRSSLTLNPLVSQIIELRRISAEARRELLGDDWFRNVKDFYALDVGTGQMPTFRPRVAIPQLQMFMLAETSELTDNDPIIYITNHEGERDKDRERVLKGHWRQEHYSIKLMMAQLWANFCGTGIIAIGQDPLAYNGRGTVWMEALDPQQFFPDPAAMSDEDWQYVIWETPKYVDEVRRQWPERGWRVPNRPIARTPLSDSGYPLSMPMGPMDQITGIPNQYYANSGLVQPRYCYLYDPTPERVKEAAGSKAGEPWLAASKFKLMFPNGRRVVECENIILDDGDNPTPHRRFPFVPYFGMPKLEGFWAPPPIRYTRGLQEYAERLLTQYFENCVRTNNAVLVCPDTAGQSAEELEAKMLPGGVIVYSAVGGSEPKFLTTAAFPPQFMESVKVPLELQKELQGYTDPRTGSPGAGNISSDLYEAALEKASRLTKLRARMSAVSTQKVAELVFYTMARFFKREINMPTMDEEFSMLPWKPISDSTEWHAWLDPGSIQPESAQNLRKQAMALRQAGAIDLQTFLEDIGVSNAKEVAEKATEEQKLAALNKIKKGSR